MHNGTTEYLKLADEDIVRNDDGGYVINMNYRQYTFPNYISAMEALSMAMHHELAVRDNLSNQIRFKANDK